MRFASVDSAENFLELNYPELYIGNRYVRFNYARDPASGEDWECLSCKMLNFTFRTSCYRCQAPKWGTEIILVFLDSSCIDPNNYVNDGQYDTSDIPNSILLIRDLDALTSSEDLFRVFAPFGTHHAAVVQDKDTNASLCFGFLLFFDIAVPLPELCFNSLFVILYRERRLH